MTTETQFTDPTPEEQLEIGKYYSWLAHFGEFEKDEINLIRWVLQNYKNNNALKPKTLNKVNTIIDKINKYTNE